MDFALLLNSILHITKTCFFLLGIFLLLFKIERKQCLEKKLKSRVDCLCVGCREIHGIYCGRHGKNCCVHHQNIDGDGIAVSKTAGIYFSSFESIKTHGCMLGLLRRIENACEEFLLYINNKRLQILKIWYPIPTISYFSLLNATSNYKTKIICKGADA